MGEKRILYGCHCGNCQYLLATFKGHAIKQLVIVSDEVDEVSHLRFLSSLDLVVSQPSLVQVVE